MAENGAFAQKLKEVRLERGFTQRQLADALGIIHQNVNNWEKGLSFPNLQTFSQLCQVLECSADYLLCKSDYPFADYTAMGGSDVYTEAQMELFPVIARLPDEDALLLLAIAKRIATLPEPEYEPPGDPQGQP